MRAASRSAFFSIDDLLEVLHEADDVAHAEDAARHALGAELLELVEASRPCRGT
jgi:hypothetical protein